MCLDSLSLHQATDGLTPMVDITNSVRPFAASLGSDLLNVSTEDIVSPTDIKVASSVFGYQTYVGEVDKSEMDVYIRGSTDSDDESDGENKENDPIIL